MRVAVFCNPTKPSDRLLADALHKGFGGSMDFVDEVGGSYDLTCVIGIKLGAVVKLLRGQPFLYFDKGYNRSWPEWWRVAANGHQPTDHLSRLALPADRAISQGWRPKPWRAAGEHILLAGSSAKYHAFYDLGCPTAYARSIVEQLRCVTDREIWYRPKPSWRHAVAIEGAKFITPKGRHAISQDLAGAHALVTHGSNASFEALMAGVPSIVLGNGISAGLSSRTLDEIDTPQLASETERNRLLANLAYCQWSLSEIRSGMMWKSYRSIMQGNTPGFTS